MNAPETLGVPLIVIVFADHKAVTPAGKPVGVPIPVAPVVVCVIAAVNGVLIQIEGIAEGADTVLAVVTVIVPIAFTEPHPPVNGIV